MPGQRWRLLPVLLTVVGVLLLCSNAFPLETDLWGRPLVVHGYVSQSAGFGIGGEHYDMQKGFQSAIFQGLLEGLYEPRSDLRLFASVRFNADWAYPILDNNAKWNAKGFNASRERLFIFDEFTDILNEAHVTWQPGAFYVRLGKQIVRWGETDGFRLMDQINPLDQRRGLADVEFETTILPLWLLRAEYAVAILPGWLQSLSLQAIFNPNLEFRPNESIQPGNTVSGIWAPNVEIPLGGPVLADFAHLGSRDAQIATPSGADGFEYAARLRAVVWDAALTLNYYDGRDKDPVERVAGPPRFEISPYDGRLILHPTVEGFYPRLRFVGTTLTTDIDPLQATPIGGVAPVLRLEAFYAFDNTFTRNADNTFARQDEVRWAVGVDWKVKLDLLNPLAFFTISPQFYQRTILGYPSDTTLTGTGGQQLRPDNYQASLLVATQYLSGKLQPSFFWLRDISERANFFRLQVVYDWSDQWRGTVGCLLFNGNTKNRSFETFSHKDQVYITVSYRF